MSSSKSTFSSVKSCFCSSFCFWRRPDCLDAISAWKVGTGGGGRAEVDELNGWPKMLEGYEISGLESVKSNLESTDGADFVHDLLVDPKYVESDSAL